MTKAQAEIDAYKVRLANEAAVSARIAEANNHWKPTLTDFLEAGEDPDCANCGHAGSLHGNDDGSCTSDRDGLPNRDAWSFLPCHCGNFELNEDEDEDWAARKFAQLRNQPTFTVKGTP